MNTFIAFSVAENGSEYLHLRFQNCGELSSTTPMLTKIVTSLSLSSELFQLLPYVRPCNESPRARLQSCRETASTE